MARFAQSFESFVGTATTTTVQSVALTAGSAPTFTSGAMTGYIGALIPNASAGNIKLRKIGLGTRVSPGGNAPVSQQMTVALFRQTTRAAGSGITTISGAGQLDPTSVASSIIGIDYANVVSATVSTAPVVGSTPIARISFNTLNTVIDPYEFLDEFVIPAGQGLAFVSIGSSNPLPANHLFTIDLDWEE